MKILILLINYNNPPSLRENIISLQDFMKKNYYEDEIDYACVSSFDDFYIYEDILTFKYKMINKKKQFNKMCDFLSKYKNEMNYDWYIKTRPEVKILDKINFNELSDISINARARVYIGPKKILYGSSTGGDGVWKNYKQCNYDFEEKSIVLDDQIYLFHNNVILNEAFKVIDEYKDEREDESFHTKYWKIRNIPLNVIGINIMFSYPKESWGDIGYSGHLNIE